MFSNSKTLIFVPFTIFKMSESIIKCTVSNQCLNGNVLILNFTFWKFFFRLFWLILGNYFTLSDSSSFLLNFWSWYFKTKIEFSIPNIDWKALRSGLNINFEKVILKWEPALNIFVNRIASAKNIWSIGFFPIKNKNEFVL